MRAPCASPPPRRDPRERGIALLLVLLLTLILVPFATEFAMQVKLESTTAVNVAEELQIENAIDGQYEVMLAYFRYDAESNDVDSQDDAWNAEDILSRTEETVNVALTTHVFDEQGKFNLLQLADEAPERRKLAKERLQRLLFYFREDTRFELSGGDAETWANEIAEWVQKGNSRANLPTPRFKDNRSMVVLDELEILPKVGDHRFSYLLADQREEGEVGPGLHRFVTIYGTGKLNLNTASEPTLRAYFPKNLDFAERIIDRRESPPEDEEGVRAPASDDETTRGNPFTQVEQIGEIEGIDPQSMQANGVDVGLDFDVRSSFFSLRIVGESQTSRRDELFVIERVPGPSPDDPIDGFRLLLRQERTDILENVTP